MIASKEELETTLQVLDDLPAMVAATRAARGDSLRTAASVIGCSHPHLWKIETGQYPLGEVLIRKLIDYIWLEA